MSRNDAPDDAGKPGGKSAPRRAWRKTGSGPSASHRMRGFEPAFGLVAAQVREAGESRGFAIARLVTHWPEVVGEDLSRACLPVKVGYTRDGLGATLTLLVRGAEAPVLEMRREEIRARVNAVYGYNAIARIHFTQTAASGFAEGRAAFEGAPKPVPVDPAVAAARKAEAATRAEGVSDPGLRDALERLAQNILSRPDRK